MERKIKLAPGEYYHLYNRGVEKRSIFLDNSDRQRFVRLLYLTNGSVPVVFKSIQGRSLDQVEVGQKKVAIGSYVLMPNHFHILVKETNEGGVSSFMEKLQTGYSMYFNKKYERVGPLFQGRFKVEHIDRDEHLKYLFAYIHLNPVTLVEPRWKEKGIQNKQKVLGHLNTYLYSSYPEYVGVYREQKIILSPKEFPNYFLRKYDFEKFVEDWLECKNPRAALG